MNGSAIGFYGETGERAVDENSPPGDGFLPSMCVEWEEAAAPAEEAGVRTVFARTGLVVSAKGGAWGRLFPLFKAGLGGGWATDASTGATSHCTTRWPHCGTCSTRSPCRAPST